MRFSDKSKGICAIVASAFGFALMALCVRLCDGFGAPVSSFQKAFFRNAIALAIAATVFVRLCAAGRTPRGIPGRDWFLLSLRVVLGTVGIFANFYALSHITIAEGQTLNKTAPFFTVLFAWLFFGERATGRQLLALLLAGVGMLLIARPGFAGPRAFPLAMGLLGGACAGGAYACLHGLRARAVDPTLIVLVFSVASCLASVPFMALRFDPMTPAQVVILSGAGAGAALGQFGITLAYGYAKPREIAVYDYSNILFTAVFGYLFLDQVADACSTLGFVAIITAAVWMYACRREDGRA